MCTISTDHILTRYTQLSIDNDNKEEQYIRLISKMGRNRNHTLLIHVEHGLVILYLFMCTISTDHILTRYTQLSIDNDNKEEQYIRLISKMGRNRNHTLLIPC